MASVCGGSLALMDAGAPIKRAVAGIAMGLVSDGSRFAVLTDIAGQEDHYGDMDFKVAGSREGITALQMDIKVSGLSRAILEQALEQARRGRLQLLDVMDRAIAEPRAEISQYAPRIFQIKIDIDQIRNVIGPGGKTIRSIVDSTGARINVEDDGTVQIATSDLEAAERAIAIIQGLTRQPKIGEEFDAQSSGSNLRRFRRDSAQPGRPGPHLGDLARANPDIATSSPRAIDARPDHRHRRQRPHQAVAAGDPRGRGARPRRGDPGAGGSAA
jgi:polyribonucleotide nucleotidyltransferase